MIMFFILMVLWVTCGIFAAGYAYSYFTKNQLEVTFRDLEDSWIVGLHGPIGLLVLWSRVDISKYSWKNPFKRITNE